MQVTAQSRQRRARLMRPGQAQRNHVLNGAIQRQRPFLLGRCRDHVAENLLGTVNEYAGWPTVVIAVDEPALGLPIAGQVALDLGQCGRVGPHRVAIDAVQQHRAVRKRVVEIRRGRKLLARPAGLVPAAPAQPGRFGQAGGVLCEPRNHFVDAISAGEIGIQHRQPEAHDVPVRIDQARNDRAALQIGGLQRRPARA